MLQVYMLPADDGDCIVLEFDKELIIIDCGTKNCYNNYLKPLLLALSKKNKQVRLLIVTHMDRDHIEGAIELISDHNYNKYINIIEIWFNGYIHLLPQAIEKIDISNEDKQILETYIRSYGYKTINSIENASARQGNTFTQLIIESGINWNSSFSGNPITEGLTASLSSDISVRILSPTFQHLNSMFRQWVRELKSQRYDFRSFNHELAAIAFEVFMSNGYITNYAVESLISSCAFSIDKLSESEYNPDPSITNKSSIAFELTYKRHRLLFLGDIEGLAILGKYPQQQIFDLIKIPHHGSSRNNPLELYEHMKSSVYLISTNGAKYNHPDLETIARIIMSNYKNNYNTKFVLNYEHNKIRPFEDENLERIYKYVFEIAKDNIVYEVQ